MDKNLKRFKVSEMWSKLKIVRIVCIFIILTNFSGSQEVLSENGTDIEDTDIIKLVPVEETQCPNVCDIVQRLEKKTRELEMKIGALEQPVWQISDGNTRWIKCSEEGPCDCYGQSKSVNCWRKSLDLIPSLQLVPKDTIFIDLGSNSLQSLHRNTFKGLGMLLHLDLSGNIIGYLPETIFHNLPELKYLILQRNELETLSPLLFRGLKSLQTLDLAENSLTSFPKSHSESLTSLKQLQLARNQIKNWENPQMINNWEELDLSSNGLESVDSFRYLRKLKRLKMPGHSLGFLTSGTFDGLTALEILDLKEGKLKDWSPSLFTDLKSLVDLFLEKNELTEVEELHFKGLDSLKELSLSGNFISTIPNRTFAHLTSLTSLNLEGNMIENILMNGFEGLANLNRLSLKNNIILQLHPDTFAPLTNLTQLDLSMNDLHFIPEGTFDHLEGSLESIQMDRNPWQCDCRIVAFANWLKDHPKIVKKDPECQGPPELEGSLVKDMTFSEVCKEEWLTMDNLPDKV